MTETLTLTEALRTLKQIRQNMATNAKELNLETMWARDLAALDIAIKVLDAEVTKKNP
jgi:hypothetical protein